MKVRVSSYILASLFTLFGVWHFVAVPRFLQMFSEMQVKLPLFTRMVLAPTSVGWLLISSTFAVLVIGKDLRPRLWLRTSLLVVIPAVEVTTVATALFLPTASIGVSSGAGK